MKISAYEDLDKACYKWLIVNARNQNVPVNANTPKVKAFYFAKQLGIDTFKVSDGWLDRCKNRFNVSFNAISGMFS